MCSPAMLSLAALLALALAADGAQAADRVLAEGGKSAYTIRVCADPALAEQHAAEELQRFLKEVTGAELPLQPAGAVPARAILVGRDAEADALAPGTDWAKLGGEGFVVRTAGDRLVLAGGRPRGTLYAVYSFLDEEVGCRWLAPEASRIPKSDRLVVKDVSRQFRPRLEYREPFATTAFDADWAARNFSNGHATRLDEKRGGKVVYQGFVHTFYTLLPPAKHFAEHPEWYSERGGKRFHEHGQLCLTNPEVLRQITEGVRDWLRRFPNATIVSVSQNDWHGACECANCKAVDEAEGTPTGALLRFVNGVAEAVEKEFPNVAIDTLAYQYTRKPPKITRPRPNVIVRLCSIECCFTHPLDTCPENKTFKEDIVGWSKICDRLYIWDYVTNFSHYLLPHPNLDVLESNIKFFIAHGVKGIFEQGNYTSLGGEMMELRSYILARLLWNPDYGAERAREEFLAGYYGPAAGPIREYLRLMHDKVKQDDIHLRCFTQPNAAHITPEVMARAEECFDQAEHLAAGRPAELARVRKMRLPVQYAALIRGRAWSREAKRAGKNIGPYGAGWSEKETAERFFATAAEAQVTKISEGGSIDPFKEKVMARVAARRTDPAPPPGTENLPAGSVIDVQDDELSFYREGQLCATRADETASDGACAWLNGASREWALQFVVPLHYLKPDKRYRAFAVVKVRKVKDEGAAFDFGIYDSEAKKGVAGRKVPAAEASAEWKAYEIGVFEPKGRPYVWIAGVENPTAVPDIFVDRLYFVEDPKP